MKQKKGKQTGTKSSASKTNSRLRGERQSLGLSADPRGQQRRSNQARGLSMCFRMLHLGGRVRVSCKERQDPPFLYTHNADH